MVDIEELYFQWLLTRLDPDGVLEGVAYAGGLLHNCEFKRRVGNDMNRANEGISLRYEFLQQFEDVNFAPSVTNSLMDQPCSWFEMLVALCRALDYLYEGGVVGRFNELVINMGLGYLLDSDLDQPELVVEYDQGVVEGVCNDIDNNFFDPNGHGGLFPLKRLGHPDQRYMEIWDQHAAYFRERLEGVYF